MSKDKKPGSELSKISPFLTDTAGSLVAHVVNDFRKGELDLLFKKGGKQLTPEEMKKLN
ncbi:MAG: hypothetical protein ACOYUZ_04355 [Patescibacteria group bacterium]